MRLIKKTFSVIIIILLIPAFFIIPTESHAADFMQVLKEPFFTGCANNSGIGKANTTGGHSSGGQIANGVNDSKATNICDWQDFKGYLNKTINWLLAIGILLSIVAIAYAGFKLIVSEGAGELEAAKKMLWAIVKGFFFMLCAWLIVKFILNGLGVVPGYSLLE